MTVLIIIKYKRVSTEYTVVTHIDVVKIKIIIFIPDANLTAIKLYAIPAAKT